jgi:hypothetical protein
VSIVEDNDKENKTKTDENNAAGTDEPELHSVLCDRRSSLGDLKNKISLVLGLEMAAFKVCRGTASYHVELTNLESSLDEHRLQQCVVFWFLFWCVYLVTWLTLSSPQKCDVVLGTRRAHQTRGNKTQVCVL